MVRWGGASERVSVRVAIGVSEEGFREVLACVAGFRESEESWRGLLRGLSQRGLQGVRLVISDAGAGLKAAMADFLPGAKWQRCTVHVMRNVLGRGASKPKSGSGGGAEGDLASGERG